jgi:PAS domain-containing protein
MAGLAWDVIASSDFPPPRHRGSVLSEADDPEAFLVRQEQPIMKAVTRVDAYQKTEAALRDRERELSQLIDMVPSHLWRLTSDGEPAFFNKRMVDSLGLDVADADKPGMSRLDSVIETVIHPDDAAQFRSELSRCLDTGEGIAMRFAYAVPTASIAGCRAARSRCGMRADASSSGPQAWPSFPSPSLTK